MSAIFSTIATRVVFVTLPRRLPRLIFPRTALWSRRGGSCLCTLKMIMIYNNTNKMDRLMSNGHQLLSHLGHLRAKVGRVLFDHVYLSTHLFAMCADVPTHQWALVTP
jgi:hypothetical protein